MVFSRGAKCSIQILFRKLSSPVHYGDVYTTWRCRGSSVAELKGSKSSFTSNYANACCAFGMFSRSYAVEVSASEQISLIKQLRERTSAPMKDVKSSLVECNWDIDAAQKDLRKKGIVLASKRSSRTAAQGLLALAQNERKAAVIELNCETDFVARNEIFQYLALSLAKLALLVDSSQKVAGAVPIGLECLKGLKMNLDHPKLSGETTIENAISEVAAMMGENVKLRRGHAFSASSNGIISTYLHASPQAGLGRIAGILSLEAEDKNTKLDSLQLVGSELAVHVVVEKPLYLTKELISADAIESEREILKSQAEATGKPQMAIEKMVEGRLRKYFEDVVLMEQQFFVDDTINVKTLLSKLSEEVGSPVKIGSFLRMEVGEGLQSLEASGSSQPLAQAA